MVWAKVILKKKVDWCTIKQAKIITMPEEQDIPTRVFRSLYKRLNLSKGPISQEEEEDDTEEFKEDIDSDGTRLTKMNTAPGPKKALKALHDQKQAWLYEGQPSAPLKGVRDVPTIVATSTTRLPNTESIMTIEVTSRELDTRTLNMPSSLPIDDFKSQLEANEVVIACPQEDVQKLLCEMKKKCLEIVKQDLGNSTPWSATKSCLYRG
jgi:hypothetical protein